MHPPPTDDRPVALTAAQVDAVEHELARVWRMLGAAEVLGEDVSETAAEVHEITRRFGELLAGRARQ
jgi:hypothetical protein